MAKQVLFIGKSWNEKRNIKLELHEDDDFRSIQLTLDDENERAPTFISLSKDTSMQLAIKLLEEISKLK